MDQWIKLRQQIHNDEVPPRQLERDTGIHRQTLRKIRDNSQPPGYVLSWEVSITLEADFCVAALQQALRQGSPEIFNTDQGSQFTSKGFIDPLREADIQISMDGRGRVFDNIFVERLWRSVKVEEVYLRDYQTVAEAVLGLGRYFEFYNHERLHQSLGYRTPAGSVPVGPSPLRSPLRSPYGLPPWRRLYQR